MRLDPASRAATEEFIDAETRNIEQIDKTCRSLKIGAAAAFGAKSAERGLRNAERRKERNRAGNGWRGRIS